VGGAASTLCSVINKGTADAAIIAANAIPKNNFVLILTYLGNQVLKTSPGITWVTSFYFIFKVILFTYPLHKLT
jgi:hypothetical protein